MKPNRFLDLSAFEPGEWPPRHSNEMNSWQDHTPFAFNLISALQPTVLVELGICKGDSHLAYCEAIVRNSLPTRCFAVDTRTGDEHAENFGDESPEGLRAEYDHRYGDFSMLLRSTFDDALTQFEDGSIDLLHVDGLHTYTAVRHYFETWRDKLSDRGVVLFNNTEVRQPDSGVRQLWGELKSRYPSFEFNHSNGLGILAVGDNAAMLLPDLFTADEETADQIRQIYSVIGNSIAFDRLFRLLLSERRSASAEIERLRKSTISEQEVATEAMERCRQELSSERKTAADEIRRLNREIASERQTATAEIQRLNQELISNRENLSATDDTLSQIYASHSWRITAPLRRLRRIPRPKELAINALRGIYHRLPVSPAERNRLKGELYRRFPKLFSQTLSYQLWKTQLQGTSSSFLKLEEPKDRLDPFEINCPPDPLVSIIIPVYGKVNYTYQCLRSLWSHRSHFSFEIIVVDDCSPDSTLETLEAIKGIRVVRNERNSGFIFSCNHGASHARGRLLVMLNNDTVVRPGWLDELVATFNCIPNSGLVGSKLIYPDGRLQEAGGVIWQDGSGWNYGRLQDPNGPAYNYLRDVDYCSGASVMITKELFDRLGGFDNHYAPAYGEDSDLAFRVRKAGARVLYQPLSQVIHFEGITSGKDVSAGVKSHQVENAKKLFSRWQEALKSHGLPGNRPELEKDRGVSGRALILDHCTPTPDQDAGSITVLNIMRILQSLGFKVTFIPEDNFLRVAPYTADLQGIGIECLYAPYVTSVEQYLSEYGEHLDLVLIFRFTAAERNLPAIRRHCPNAKIILHTSDLHHLREQREAELMDSDGLRRQAQQTKDRELRLIKAMDATIVHSSAEKQMLDQEIAQRQEQSRIFLFPWAIEIPGTGVPFDQRNGMVFIGGFQHQPNVDAVLYFAEEIFPLVRQRMPDAIFYIVGSKAPPEIVSLAGNGIEVLGFVDDLATILDRCRLSVVPLRYGAGIKGKIGSSLSYGLPCVSTTIGAEGMELTEEDGVLVADNPGVFADSVLRIHQDPQIWEAYSQGGLDFVRRNYSLEAGAGTVKALLLEIGIHQATISSRQMNCQHDKALSADVAFAIDQPDDPLESVKDVCGHDAYREWTKTAVYEHTLSRDRAIISELASAGHSLLPGYCRICESAVDFNVDPQQVTASSPSDLGKQFVCPHCNMSSSERMIAYAARDIVMSKRDRRPGLYLMEHNTPLHNWIRDSLPQADCIGSAYQGKEAISGQVIKGDRHENAPHLNFADSSFDLIIINDVLQHVAEPRQALTEAFRVLRPRGQLLVTVPLDFDSDESVTHLKTLNDQLAQVVGESNSTVVTEFGWDLLQDFKKAGFLDARLRFYWSEVYGHLGTGQHYIQAVKG